MDAPNNWITGNFLCESDSMCLKKLVEMCQYNVGQDLSIRWKEVQTMDSNAVMDIYGIPQTACTDGIEQVLTHLFHKVEGKLYRSGNTSLEQIGEPFANIGYRFKRAGDLRGVPPKIHKVWGLKNLAGYETLGHKILMCEISPMVWY